MQIVYLIVDFSVEKIRNNKLIMRLQVFIKSFDKLHGTGYSCTLVTMTTLGISCTRTCLHVPVRVPDKILVHSLVYQRGLEQ